MFAVHDASDIFLEVGKLTKYSGLEVVPSISFILFAISWFILRLIIFPFVVIRSTRYMNFVFSLSLSLFAIDLRFLWSGWLATAVIRGDMGFVFSWGFFSSLQMLRCARAGEGCHLEQFDTLLIVGFYFHSYESLQYMDESMVEGPIVYYVFNTLLITLQVMHVYWWVLIWRMIMKQIQDRGKISDDVRSGNNFLSSGVIIVFTVSVWVIGITLLQKSSCFWTSL